ncbi:PLP-dependent transferase [Jeotgalicoccus halotolerans]|uniref:PLP-dependent transferase n=1 Tax=Jeotgalicoccus nanhaiensis TaxID=568603 RepID=A0ABR9XY46_9STAP|nr:PLP-dependent transferase [Jeotgalicoccus nanhaiensis]MBF0753901.1 PLP-dependent transferase [Jeotgalicoccus nanhaiensis]TFU62057.1 methionine biosynthesis PLP-dependent protein [Jeotgalicoccus nanhaiensis]
MLDTKLSQISLKPDHTGATTNPIYLSTAFEHEGVGKSTGYDYTRTKNPTRTHFEEAFADLEGGTHSFATSSGMAAVQLCCNLFNSGDEVLVSFDLYGGTYRIFDFYEQKYNVKFHYADFNNHAELTSLINSNTRAFFIEPITNPSMEKTDLAPLYKLAQENDIITIIDNTFLTPYLSRPLIDGADIVLHSATKYIGGHNDVLAGVVTVKDEVLAESLSLYHNMIGATLSPFDGFLLLRGLKTLHVRMDRAIENARKTAAHFENHEAVEEVLYAGTTGMLSLRFKETHSVNTFLENIEVCTFAESLGGTETFITFPFTQTHAEMPDEERIKRGIDDSLIRLSIGIENSDDIIQDIEQALNKSVK